MKKYRNDMPKKNMSSEPGCVKQPYEEKVEMLKNGGGRYSVNNPKELTKATDALAKVVK